MEPGGRVWFAATSTGANHAAIGRLDPATLNAALFELPPECDHPSSLVVERGGGAVWFCCFNWNQLATTGAFLGRLDLGTATLDYWSLPGRGPVCFRIAAAQVATPPDIWFTFYDWPSLGSLPNASRLFRFHVPTSTFYEYGSPTLTQPAHVALDRTASAWMTDRDTVRMVRRGANCGVVAFDHRRARVKARDGRAKADEDVATPATQPAPATVSTVGRTREPCLANYSIAPAAPLGIAVHNPAGSQTNVYYTDGGNNVIGRLVP
jgi:streptogramin lyase